MPISLVPIGPRTRLTAVGTGNLSLNDLKTFIAASGGLEQRRLPVLLDLSQATTDLKTPDLQTFASLLAEQIQQTGAQARVAVFAPSDEIYGVLRMLISYCAIVGVDYMAVFRSRYAAEAWLENGQGRRVG